MRPLQNHPETLSSVNFYRICSEGSSLFPLLTSSHGQLIFLSLLSCVMQNDLMSIWSQQSSVLFYGLWSRLCHCLLPECWLVSVADEVHKLEYQQTWCNLSLCNLIHLCAWCKWRTEPWIITDHVAHQHTNIFVWGFSCNVDDEALIMLPCCALSWKTLLEKVWVYKHPHTLRGSRHGFLFIHVDSKWRIYNVIITS